MLTIKPIMLDDNKLLRKKSVAVSEPYSQEDLELAKYMHEYLVFSNNPENIEKYHLRSGVGLAAPQLGINKKIIAIYIAYKDEEGNDSDVTEFAFINPKIVSHSARFAYLLGGEGCLSVPVEHQGYVPRYAFITIEAYDALTDQYLTIKFRGYEAIVVQHELDHLDGILFYDRINKNDPFKRIEGALEI